MPPPITMIFTDTRIVEARGARTRRDVPRPDSPCRYDERVRRPARQSPSTSPDAQFQGGGSAGLERHRSETVFPIGDGRVDPFDCGQTRSARRTDLLLDRALYSIGTREGGWRAIYPGCARRAGAATSRYRPETDPDTACTRSNSEEKGRGLKWKALNGNHGRVAGRKLNDWRLKVAGRYAVCCKDAACGCFPGVLPPPEKAPGGVVVAWDKAKGETAGSCSPGRRRA
jgi:hypothetical protein